MVHVDLWADPACAWSWSAYLWLESLADDKDLSIAIQPFSLAIRSAWRGEDVPPPLRVAREESLRVLRVATQVTDRRTDFFAAATRPAWHAISIGQRPSFDIGAGLRAASLTGDLAACADDVTLDAEIERSMRSVADVIDADPVSQTIPVLAFDVGGQRRGFLGPLLDPVPDNATSAKIWDAVLTLASEPAFLEFSRPRSQHSLTRPRQA